MPTEEGFIEIRNTRRLDEQIILQEAAEVGLQCIGDD